MFRCELQYDVKKANKYGYTSENIQNIVDNIFKKIGVPKVSEGIYEDKDSDDSNLTMMTTFYLLDCPVVVHFCTKWKMYDPEEGDQGPCEINLILRRKKIQIKKNVFFND